MDDFMGYVQIHERSWGTDRYLDKPDLQEIIKSPVVVFWQAIKKGDDERYRITLHESLEEIEQYFTKILFRSTIQSPEGRVVRIFEQGIQVRIKSVKIAFEKVPTK